MAKVVVDWPALNTLVWLKLPCCESEHPTRIEDFLGDYCIVGAPMSPHPDLVDPRAVAKRKFSLGWSSGKGALHAPVEIVTSDLKPIPTWTLKNAGKVIETQRRSYVRLDTSLTVRLYMLEGGAPSEARLLDISEGGLRCQVDKWATDPGAKQFSTKISLDTREYYLRSQIAWRGYPDDHGNRQLGVRFVEVDRSVADSIRAYIFAAQLAERRRKNAL